jgi:ATP-dependent DNA helicase DinG
MVAPLPRPAFHASHAGLWLADAAGETRQVSRREAIRALGETPHLLINAPLGAARLGLDISGLDLLELFVFVCPARFIVPASAGLAAFLGIPAPQSPATEAAWLRLAAAHLLARIAAPGWQDGAGALVSAQRLQRRGWPWAPDVLEVMPAPAAATPSLFEVLPTWEEGPARPAPRATVLGEAAIDARLGALRGARREERPGQQAYARAIAPAFQPRATRDGPNLVIAEAGTGTGKTLGYLAPASLLAEAGGGTPWISTFTRALQRQLMAEVEACLPPRIGGRPVVVRKGRENYLCLLNLEDAMQGQFSGRAGQFAELVARWARFTRDGDMVGGDLPGWLPALFRNRNTVPALTDRRGECIRAACPHYRACFIERSVRASADASLVIANHALVLATVARGGAEAPARLIFDEGHHLHDAADSAFRLALTGAEAIELRRWFLGPEGSGRRPGRRRGLAARLLDVTSADADAARALDDLAEAARALPADGWLDRIGADAPDGPLEAFLAAARAQVLARSPEESRGFGLECEIADPLPQLVEAAHAASRAFDALAHAIARLKARLHLLIAEQPEWLDAPGLARLEAAEAGLDDRLHRVAAWNAMLARIGAAPDPDFVDWLAVPRVGGQERDAGMFRYWLDPLKPLADAVLARAHGVLVTSATLADPAMPEATMRAAAGADHLAIAPTLFRAASPFDYAAQARVFIATDVRSRDPASLALAFSRLIEASGGGTLGLFTAIARLREVHARIADRLAALGLPLFAQHVDPMDTATLVDLFRADPNASILGTDALRDGVDVPGQSLRLLLFEGIPWSRPSILETARRAAFGGAAWEDRMVRRRLAQAFGRLIRRADDRGVFVLLGPQVPGRLLSALPEGVPVARLPLAEVAAQTAAFLAPCQPKPSFLGQRQPAGE